MKSSDSNGDIKGNQNGDVETGSTEETPVSGTKEQNVLSANKFRHEYRQEPKDHSVKQTCCMHVNSLCSCSGDGLVKGVQKTIPFIRIMKKYKPRTDLPNDIIAGFTVGVMQLPQGRSMNKY